MAIKYKVKSKGETVLDTVIERTGNKIEFTLGELQASIKKGKKDVKEITSQLKVHEAEMENIKHHYPDIAKMSVEDLTAAYMYRRAMGVVNEAKVKIDELIEAIAEDEQAIKDIQEQTGVKLPKEVLNEAEGN
jgi:archaellum component FlaC